MKKFLNSRFGEAIILIASSIVNLILTIALYSIKLTDNLVNSYERGETTLWTCDQLFLGSFVIRNFNLYFIVAFLIGLLLIIASAVIALIKSNKKLFYASFGYNIGLSLTILITNVVCDILRGGAIICAVLSAIVSSASLIFMIKRRNNQIATDQSQEREITPKKAAVLKTGMLICEIVAMVISVALFVFPLYSSRTIFDTENHLLIHALTFENGDNSIFISVCFIVMFFACLASMFSFISAISFFGKSNNLFAKKSQKYLYFTAVLSILFFLMGYGATFFVNLTSAGEKNSESFAATTSYVPSLLVMATLVIHSILQGQFTISTDITQADKVKEKQFKFEPLIYIFILTAITFASLALVLIDVQVGYGGAIAYEIKKTGYDLLTNHKDLDAGLQVVAFAFVAILITSGTFLALSLVSYFTRSKSYYSVVKTGAFTNFVFMLMIGLFGLYYQIAQKINSEHMFSLLQQYGIPVLSEDYIENVTTQSYIATIASFVVLLFMFFRKQFNLNAEPVVAELAQTSEENEAPQPVATVAQEDVAPTTDKTVANFDACPAFTELDGKIDQFEAELENKRQSLFTNLTLPNLVRFVVDYARESRLHLSYSLEDIATFVAGLGASRLSILQGMSGTGKTSLPKIFTEAIMGNCEIVEVESSWRDKNELLGYYNEFSKCFTPKKFTQCLYKARLNSSVLTFIVLDEMNLSRIEYYFSDFLSLMENEEHKREIKLLNIKLFRREDGQAIPYRGLTDGHTIKIPTNVWFIGTANRDESTFEISDKVYDRAQTMNFNKRAPKVHSFSEPLPQRFASYDMLIKLFDEAKSDYVFEAEDNTIIQKVEKILMPYNISFGNRILKQMEDFVKIYCTCFGDKAAVENDAVEKILLSKVVSKLENKIVENKDALATEFNKLGLSRCSAFIQKLNED